MEQGFIDILKKVADKHGKEYFSEVKKCRAIVSDYTGSEYINERGLLLRAVEAGVPNALLSVEKDDIELCMKAMQRKLQEEQFMDASIAWSVVIVLANVLRGVEVKEVKTDVKSGLGKYDEAMAFYHDQQYDKAIPILERLALENHAEAQYRLGFCYYKGQGVGKDNAKALEWHRKAAEQGLSKAQHILGAHYHLGKIVPKDYAKAIEWYGKAAEQGNDEAQCGLGNMYLLGEGVPKDNAKAAEWYRKAAELGNTGAQYNLDKLKKEGKI